MAAHWDGNMDKRARAAAAPIGGVGKARHQSRNLFAALRSIVSLSSVDNAAVETFAMHLMGRIDALARVHAKVSRSALGLVDLEELVADELSAQSGLEASDIAGPQTHISTRTAELLGIVFHELAVNAVKFGALAYDGSVTVRWRLVSGSVTSLAAPTAPSRLEIRWVERGVPVMDTRPQKRGFGLTVIEEALAYDVDGEGSVTFSPRGVECVILVPLLDGPTGD